MKKSTMDRVKDRVKDSMKEGPAVETSARTIPKYQDVKEYLLSAIRQGDLDVGQRIPSEKQLMGLFGVSSITVRRAMGELAAEGILRRIKGKGSYVAHPGAFPQGRARGSGLVAFVIATAHDLDSSYLQIIKGIQSFLSPRQYSLLVEYTDEDPVKERDIIGRLLQSDIAGLLIFPAEPRSNTDLFATLRREGVPFVILDRAAPNFPVNHVTSNNHEGAYVATEHLIGLGHTRIAFIGSHFLLSSVQERYHGYCDALAMAGIPFREELVHRDHTPDGATLARRIREGDVTAILAANDLKALEIMGVLRQQDIDIPGQVSLVGYDDFEACSFANIPLSTVRQDFELMGSESAKLLVRSIRHREVGCRRIMLPTKLVLRRSTGPCPRGGGIPGRDREEPIHA